MSASDFASFITENHISPEVVPEASGNETSDMFSATPDNAWDEGGECAVIVDKVFDNLAKKLNAASYEEELAMIFEFICQHGYNRSLYANKVYAKSGDALHQKASSIYKDLYAKAFADAESWSVNKETMKLSGEYLKVASAISTKFTGEGYASAMLYLTIMMCGHLQGYCTIQIDAANDAGNEALQNKGIFNRAEMDEKIESCNARAEGWKETSDMAESWMGYIDEGYKLLYSKTDDYFL